MLTFDLAPEQYTYAYKDYNKNLKPGLEKSSLPLRCVIKPSPRWTKMPKLQVGHIVAVNGFLSRVLQKDDGKVQFFEVEVEQVNILGKTSVPIGPNQFVDTGKSILFFL
jgi:aspartyl/asparaginyl-tRNA synthetase